MNTAEFYKSYTDTLAAFAKAARAETVSGFGIDESIARSYEEGFKDAMAHAFTLLTGNNLDDEQYETSCEDALCNGRDCNSNYCENLYDSTICNVCAQDNLDVFQCPDVKDCCLACCKCPEHKGEGWTTEDTKPSTACEHSNFSTSPRPCSEHHPADDCWENTCDNCDKVVGHDK